MSEAKGWQNQYDYGYRIYDARIGRFLSVDPLSSSYPSWSPYPFAMNSPISGIDLDGLEYYYTADGKLLGNRTTDAQGNKLDEKTANSVRLATSVSTVKDEKTGRSYQVFDNEQDLNISHTDFQISANIIKHESQTGDQMELLYIAHTAVNRAEELKTDVKSLLSTSYSSVKKKNKVALPDSDESNAANHARAGLINALSGAPDPTNGATFWDGTDLLAWGTKGPYGAHAKLREMGIEVSESLYNSYLAANQQKYGSSVRYGKKRYSLPHSVFNDSKYRPQLTTYTIYDNVHGFMYERHAISLGIFKFPALQKPNRGKIKLRATATAGLSIFWATIK